RLRAGAWPERSALRQSLPPAHRAEPEAAQVGQHHLLVLELPAGRTAVPVVLPPANATAMRLTSVYLPRPGGCTITTSARKRKWKFCSQILKAAVKHQGALCSGLEALSELE